MPSIFTWICAPKEFLVLRTRNLSVPSLLWPDFPSSPASPLHLHLRLAITESILILFMHRSLFGHFEGNSLHFFSSTSILLHSQSAKGVCSRSDSFFLFYIFFFFELVKRIFMQNQWPIFPSILPPPHPPHFEELFCSGIYYANTFPIMLFPESSSIFTERFQ